MILFVGDTSSSSSWNNDALVLIISQCWWSKTHSGKKESIIRFIVSKDEVQKEFIERNRSKVVAATANVAVLSAMFFCKLNEPCFRFRCNLLIILAHFESSYSSLVPSLCFATRFLRLSGAWREKEREEPMIGSSPKEISPSFPSSLSLFLSLCFVEF